MTFPSLPGISFSILLAVSFVGCSRDSTFCTYAQYEAPRSGYSIRVFGSGSIPSGADHSTSSQGKVLMCPLDAQKSEGIRLTVRDDAKVEYEILGTRMKGTEQWDWSTKHKALTKYLTLGGLSNLTEAEIKETASVIGGVMAGPKGTILKGQSDLLKVLEVDYRYEKCDAEMSNISIRRMSSCG